MASSSRFSVEFGNAFEGVSPQYSSAIASSSEKPWDVFINHYGEDVKNTFAASIYDILNDTQLRVFLDNEALEPGDIFPARIEEAMRSASLHIAIFSPDYAKSPWCLSELSFMIQSETGTKIIPVFYHVEPWHLRWPAQETGAYASAFSDYEEKGRYPKEKLDQWKEALQKSSILSGRVVRNNFDEGRVLKEIANQVLKTTGKPPLYVAKHPVGMDRMVQELQICIDLCAEGENKAKIVGIVGVEGVGKTTLAREVYNRKYFSFKHTSFIKDVRDAASKSAIHDKQKKLLMDMGNSRREGFSFDNWEEGKTILGGRLRSKSALIVLDDVSEEDQLDALLPENPRDQLGCNSLIIVTSRKLRVLIKWGISSNAIYKMEGLDDCDAEQLLCQHAFSQPRPKQGYEDTVRKFLIECKGLPLFLKQHGEKVCVNSTDDIERERQLPPHYHKILSRAVPQKHYLSKKEIYDALCNSIQIQEGKQSVWLDQSTGKIGLKTSASSLSIKHGDDNRYWQLVSTDESRFGQVKKLIGVWCFRVHHRIECTLLSSNTQYTVAFVVKINQSEMNLYSHQSPFVFSLKTIEGNLKKYSALFLDDFEKSVDSHGEFSKTPVINAEDGWIEFAVGDFLFKEDDGSGQAIVIDVLMENDNTKFKKSGICLDGVKITPKKTHERAAQIMVERTNSSEIEWARTLPPNYQKILSRAIIQKEYTSKEEFNYALSNSIQIGKGKQMVWLDRLTGKIGFKASARSMSTTHSDENGKWRWLSTQESSFGEVKELLVEYYSKVYARLECTLLSPETEYTVALIVKIDHSRMCSHQSPFEFSLKTIEGKLIQSARFLDDLEKPVRNHGGFDQTPLRYAQNGWMEFVVGDFFLKETYSSGKAIVIDVFMQNTDTRFKKSGILLDGIKITPNQ